MKKISFIFSLFCFFPFLSFCGLKSDDFISVNQVRVFSFNSSGSLVATVFNSPTVDSVPSLFYSRPLAFIVSGARLTHPYFVSVVSTNGSSSASIDSCIRGSTVYNSRDLWYSPFVFAEIANIYGIAWSLYSSGYRGPAFQVFHEGNNSNAYNFVFTDLLSDVLSSTNSTYRQIVLSSLSSISQTINNIELNLGGLQSSIDSGNNLSSNLVSIGSSINLSSSNLVSIGVSLTNSVSALRDPFVFDFTNAVLKYTDDVSGRWTSSHVDYLLSTYASLDNDMSKILFARAVSDDVRDSDFIDSLYSSISSHPSDIRNLGGLMSEEVVDALIGDYPVQPSKGGKSSSVRTSIKSQLQDWRQDVRQQLNDWKDDLKQDLQAWKTSDEKGYLNVRDAVRDSVNGNFSAYNDSTRTNDIPYYVFQTNYVTRPVTSAVDNASAQIQSNATQNAEATRDFLSNWFDDGINVKIQFPLEGETMKKVAVQDDLLIGTIDSYWQPMRSDLTVIADAIDWFSNHGIPLDTNLYLALDNLLDAVTNRPSPLLLSDYGDYISNGVYSSSLDVLSSDYPNVYSNLLKFGLSPSGDGNFWTLFGGNLLYQSALIGSLLDDMKMIRDFADDNIDGGFSSGISSIVKVLPSSSHISSVASQASNVLVNAGMSTNEFFTAFYSVTNHADSAFRPFHGVFDSLPDQVVFFKTGNEQYFSVPVGHHPEVFRTMRYGFSFALAAVNFVLFPKFVLFFVTLFGKLSNRFVRFYPSVRNE